MARYPQKLDVDSGGRRITYVLRPDAAEPVYAIEGSGGEATASGRVWVRFADGTDASERAAALAEAGYAIDSVPGYATNAAYVRAENVAASLEGLDRLRRIGGVEHVEPEMLRPRTFRG